MSPATNWLSFSPSPAEMQRSSDENQFFPFEPSPSYFIDNIYSNGWCTNTKPEPFYPEGDDDQRLAGYQAPSIADSLIFLDNTQSAPKLADFFGGDSTVRYSDDQMETRESSQTIVVDQNSVFSGDMASARFQAFSANSGSEVDDPESARSELGVNSCPTGGLSLGVTQTETQCTENQQESNNDPIVSGDTFGQRTSIYRGVTRHRWTGRYEAHLWDNSCRREGQARRGRQGGYDKEEKAARAYDLAALKYWGHTANTNFPVSSYSNEIEAMKNATKQEFIASLRRRSSGFSRGASIYRGVTRHHQQGRWQARIGRVAGNKDLYLGTFATEEEAAEAYDIAAIKFRGIGAVTNFEMSRYDIEAISASTLPIGGATKRLKRLQEASNSISFSALQPVASIVPMVTRLYRQDSLFHPDSGGANCTSSAEFYL